LNSKSTPLAEDKGLDEKKSFDKSSENSPLDYWKKLRMTSTDFNPYPSHQSCGLTSGCSMSNGIIVCLLLHDDKF
jgi:hypothetical protein